MSMNKGSSTSTPPARKILLLRPAIDRREVAENPRDQLPMVGSTKEKENKVQMPPLGKSEIPFFFPLFDAIRCSIYSKSPPHAELDFSRSRFE